MEDKQDQAPKKRGRPKDPNAPKAAYNLSTKERARRATQKRLSAAKKRATKTSQAAADRKQYAKTLEKAQLKLKKLCRALTLPQSILGIWMLCRTQCQSLWAKAKSYFSRMMALKQTFSARVKRDVLCGGAAGGW